MASVSGGSQLSIYGHGKSGANVNVDLTTDGTGTQPDPVNGKLNVEVFTTEAGPLAPGYDASILVPGATLVDNNTVSNVGQLNVTEVLLTGSFTVVDETGHESISIQGAAAGGDSMTVVGSIGDTISGSSNPGTSQLIDASDKNKDNVDGPETIIGGAGSTTVLAGAGDSIVGSSGDMLIQGGSNDTIVGGSGTITVQGGSDDSIVAGNGGTISVNGHGGHGQGNNAGGNGQGNGGGNGNGNDDAAKANAANASVQGAGADTITGSDGLTFVESGQGASTVVGFNTLTDVVQSTTSVNSSGEFLGSSKSTEDGTTLTFVDNSTMFLAGVTDMNQIKFTK